MTSRQQQPLTQRRLRTPSAAAYAGIIFALLLSASMALIQYSVPNEPPFDSGWLREHIRLVSIAIGLVPFAGIAFLWFVGVIRSQVGELEDQFFSSVFFGSGILFLGGVFVWMTVISAVLLSAAVDPDLWTSSGAYIFGLALIRVMGSVVIVRMAGVFMFSSSAIWLRTKVMPRWLIYVTIGLALVMLIGGPLIRQLRFAFPLWVIVVSVFLLRAQRLVVDDDEEEAGTE